MLQVFFRKRANNQRDLLRKMTYENKASYVSLPTCINMESQYNNKENMAIYIGHVYDKCKFALGIR